MGSGLGGAIMAALLFRFGLQPFSAALQLVTWRSVVLALIITAATTACCAWRWSLVADAVGMHLQFPTAVWAYYRSQFVNATLPGGVIGDVDRAIRGSGSAESLSQRSRSVVWDRATGQAVSIALTTGTLAFLPSPVTAPLATVAATGAVVVAIASMLLIVATGASGRATRVVRAVRRDLSRVAGETRRLVRIAAASILNTIGHVAVFLIAVRSALPEFPLSRAVPVALVVLLASAVPTNIAGWGPREGVAAWAFSVSGAGASAGVTVTVSYGLLVVLATLPGAAAVLWTRRHPRHSTSRCASLSASMGR